MSVSVPDSLKDEFTQEEWNGLTDAERQGVIEDGSDDGNPTPEELERQQEEDRQREADAAAAAEAAKQPTDAEREAAAAAAAATGKTPEQIQQEEAAAAAAQQQAAPVTPRPRGVVTAELPEDFDQKVSANAQAVKDNDAAYDNGDISHEEWRVANRKLDKESRELDRLADRAELAKESSEQALINHWTSVINPFTAAHPELSEDDVTKTAFDTYLRQTTGPVMEAGGLPGQVEIDKAYELWCKRFNFTPSGGQQQAAKRDIKVPPTLGGLPASSTTSVEDGKLAAISRLEGVAYEEALAKLLPAEVEQMSKYA